jgi:RHS repeat-associated protein
VFAGITGTGTTDLILLGDQLGSTSVTANSSGTKVAELRYKPLGRTRYSSGTTPSTYRFTGQRAENLLGGVEGLYFYGSRWYDDSLGRFIQPDSIIPESSNPADFDRYSYVRNNPVTYNDPDGHLPCENGTFNCNNPHNTDSKPANPGQNNDNKNLPFDDSLGGNNTKTEKSPQVSNQNDNLGDEAVNWGGAIAGIGMIIVGGVMLYIGIVGTAASVSSLNIELAGLAALAWVPGGLLIYGGTRTLIDSGLIPGTKRK